MSELRCARCGQEIKPGDPVDFVYAGDEPPRIVVSGELLVTHVTCPDD